MFWPGSFIPPWGILFQGGQDDFDQKAAVLLLQNVIQTLFACKSMTHMWADSLVNAGVIVP